MNTLQPEDVFVTTELIVNKVHRFTCYTTKSIENKLFGVTISCATLIQPTNP